MQQLKNYPDFLYEVELGLTYIYKGQCVTELDPVSGVPLGTQYRIKAWEVDSPEPPWFEDPDLVPSSQSGYIESGSLLFFAHEVTASFGSISVTPLN